MLGKRVEALWPSRDKGPPGDSRIHLFAVHTPYRSYHRVSRPQWDLASNGHWASKSATTSACAEQKPGFRQLPSFILVFLIRSARRTACHESVSFRDSDGTDQERSESSTSEQCFQTPKAINATGNSADGPTADDDKPIETPRPLRDIVEFVFIDANLTR